ncbi:MAG TPA: cbb3-type cytochrome c oxidase N-terminal domain-containing protein [Cyclobacteriaceae bacterium]|nr:cbb3-type cytochrome c oxidase N-terminal domain-containing protein [Cyclobacteriaceae bacterium]
MKYITRILLLLGGLTFSLAASAQETTAPSFWDDPVNHPLTPLYVVTTFVLIAMITVLVVAFYLLRILNLLIEQSAKESAAKLGKTYVERESWWSKLVQKLNASVPVAQEKDIDLGHNYDGIRELDNHLPPWWKWLFYGTIGWAVVYLVVYHLSNSLPLSIEEYQDEVAQAEMKIQKLKASQPQAEIDEATLTFTNDAAIIEKGKKVFTDYNCGSCHRNDGGGNTIGPNLTDAYWLHGGDIKNIFATIKNGVVEKGMPAWGKAMSPDNVRDAAFFVMSLQGTNPPDAKAPQGELFKSPDAPPPADTTHIEALLNE